MISPLESLLLIATTLYQAIATWFEDQKSPPGQLIDVGGYCLHLYTRGDASPTVILEHSLGGIEGYLLIEEIAKITRVCIYDRAGYGWSDHSPHPRTSEQMVAEMDVLFSKAAIEPPYILVGDSFGSYNVRLYAYRFPEKVAGIILTDGLHEAAMLKMSLKLQALKLFFLSGFVMSTLGSTLGIVRVLKTLKVFELIKPELSKFPQEILNTIKRSFCRPKHWITMSREIRNLDNSSRQVSIANNFGALPIVNIKAHTFFKPSFWTIILPLRTANQLREEMHKNLQQLSTDCSQIQAHQSSHFVWVDEPELIVTAIKNILTKVTFW